VYARTSSSSIEHALAKTDKKDIIILQEIGMLKLVMITQIGSPLWENTVMGIETNAENASLNLQQYTTSSYVIQDFNRNQVENGLEHHQTAFIRT